MGDPLVVLARKFVNRKETLFSIEGKMTGVIISEIIGAVAIADGEQLDEAEQGAAVAIARIVLVLNDLLPWPALD